MTPCAGVASARRVGARARWARCWRLTSWSRRPPTLGLDIAARCAAGRGLSARSPARDRSTGAKRRVNAAVPCPRAWRAQRGSPWHWADRRGSGFCRSGRRSVGAQPMTGHPWGLAPRRMTVLLLGPLSGSSPPLVRDGGTALCSPSAVDQPARDVSDQGNDRRGCGIYRAVATTIVAVSRKRVRAWCWSAPPGAGKTTVGRVLARRWATVHRRRRADRRAGGQADRRRCSPRTARTPSARWSAGRWPKPSPRPTACSRSAAGRCSPRSTRERLRGHRVVHLKVGLADGIRRTGMSTARPLLAGVNPRATFKALLDARAPLYREVATVEIETSRQSPNQVVRAVLEALGEEPAAETHGREPTDHRPGRRAAPAEPDVRPAARA